MKESVREALDRAVRPFAERAKIWGAQLHRVGGELLHILSHYGIM